MGARAFGRQVGAAALVAIVIFGLTGVESGAQTPSDRVNASTKISFSVKGIAKCATPCKGQGSYNPIDATLITVATDDEVTIELQGISGTTVHRIIWGDNRVPGDVISLTVPVMLNAWVVTCQNEAQKCNGSISILGMTPSAG